MIDEAQERELIQTFEQLARWARHFFLRLTAEGFTDAEALALTRTWMRGIQSGAGSGDE
jgi:hypothetical protein